MARMASLDIQSLIIQNGLVRLQSGVVEPEVLTDVDLQAVIDSGEFELDGPQPHPADRFGAQGQGLAVYVKDPDGNTVELRTYPHR